MLHHPGGELQLHREMGAVGAGGGRGLIWAPGRVRGLPGAALRFSSHRGQKAEQQPQTQGRPNGMQRHGLSLADPHHYMGRGGGGGRLALGNESSVTEQRGVKNWDSAFQVQSSENESTLCKS